MVNYERYLLLKSPLHLWNSKWKLITLTALSLCALIIRTPVVWLLLFSIILIFIALSDISYGDFFRHLKPVAIMAIIISPFILLSYPGAYLFNIGPLQVTHEGVVYMVLLLMRMGSIYSIFLLLFMTTPIFQVIKVLQDFKVPSKFVDILIFTYRYIFLYMQNLKQMWTSIRLRGFTYTTGVGFLKVIANIIITLIVGSYDQSQRVYQAMLLRGMSHRTTTGDLIYQEGPKQHSLSVVLGIYIAVMLIIESGVWI